MSAAILEWTYKDQVSEASAGTLISEITIRTHANIFELEAEIEAAKSILKLPDNWDGEGSPRYSRATLEQAIAFVRMHMEHLWEASGINAPLPCINPGPMGSIDLHWKQPTWELLVNISAEETQPATFYGDDYGAGVIKGTVHSGQSNFGLLEWLMK